MTVDNSGYRPTIGITLGDPAGIGPEVIVKALADPVLRHRAKYIIYGMNELLAYAADLAEFDVFGAISSAGGCVPIRMMSSLPITTSIRSSAQ
jgi:4-hydroxythreonine-4-phosphate dehydrogenase